MTHQLDTYGLILLFFFVAIEGLRSPASRASGTGRLRRCSPSSGHFNIVAVIAVAAAERDHRG